ncbi:hypothetical protein EHS13_16920 [Paenibacillus psychroresistens]|uniref:GGDEF domain-containing protein n=1 Tax=Paenibacillus psychroresistens TaxID=1778678 RepID=A0A6B8RLP2_9BACL|nr:hypothetical protein [Paenibacillus psychroresistens]QGQ96445.1 hypothetical protein EHS13_16920 [Paenibacillus psychroresistens]
MLDHTAETTSNEKGITIGIIGPPMMVKNIQKALKGFPSFSPIVKAYTDEAEVPKLAKELCEIAEVLLFSGLHPYKIAKEQMNFPIPVHYLPLTGMGLFRALFRVQKSEERLIFTVDSLSKKLVEKTFIEMGADLPAIVCYDGSPNPSTEELVSFHRKLYASHRGGIAITGIKSVADMLTKEGIPNDWIVPTEHDIIVSLERALLSTVTRRSKESQIVVGMINVDEFGRLVEKKKSEHDIQRLKLDIYRMLIGYVESLEGHLTHLGGDDYLFFTTRGIFERETGGYKSIPLAHELEKAFHLSLSIGIGFGRSASEAGTHARMALRNAKEAGGNICFIIREDGSMIGPLEMAAANEVDLSMIPIELIERTENSGMTQVYLSKMAAYITRHGKTEYTADELSTCLGVTIRSTHRLLSNWVDEKLIDIIGEEKPSAKGRPKQIYRLAFLSELIRR